MYLAWKLAILTSVAQDQNQYQDLVDRYPGLYVLIREEAVVFSDRSANVVLNYAEKTFPDRKWIIRKIDNGDLVFYGTYLSNKEIKINDRVRRQISKIRADPRSSPPNGGH